MFEIWYAPSVDWIKIMFPIEMSCDKCGSKQMHLFTVTFQDGSSTGFNDCPVCTELIVKNLTKIYLIKWSDWKFTIWLNK